MESRISYHETDESDNQNQEFCRMYPNPLPEVGATVVGVVVLLEDSSAIVELPEYGELEAMVQYSELSQKRIKSLRSHIHQDKLDVFEVIRVDPEKEYVDLSKKHLTDADREAAMAKFACAKAIHSMVRQLAVTQHMTMLEVCEKAIWPLYSHGCDAYTQMGAALEQGNFQSLFDRHTLSAKFLEQLEKCARQRFRKNLAEIHARIEVTCFGRDGVDAVITALKAGLTVSSSKSHPVQISLLSSPKYSIRTTHEDPNAGKALLNEAIKAIEGAIAEFPGGQMVLTMPPAIGSGAKEEIEPQADKDLLD